MGPKGSNVQAITQDHDVSIKFPDRERSSGSVSGSTVPNGAAGGGEGTRSGGGGSGDGDTPTINGDDGPGGEEAAATTTTAAAPAVDPRSIILITGRQDNAEAAKQALMVSALILFKVYTRGKIFGLCSHG